MRSPEETNTGPDAIALLTPYLTDMRADEILTSTPQGLFCKRGGFYIDPVRTVEKALITHGHSDHARAGHGAVLATKETLDIMRLRHGSGFAGSAQAAAYSEPIRLDGVSVTFRPAGHVLGAVRGDPLRRLHHRGDLWPSGLSPRGAQTRDREALALGRSVS
jgi:L-ascorbate metabolism protein UlaG (beta-lactamase superfamily)